MSCLGLRAQVIDEGDAPGSRAKRRFEARG